VIEGILFKLAMTFPSGHLLGQDVPGGIRTPNLLIRSQLLYPVELQTQFVAAAHSTCSTIPDKLSHDMSARLSRRTWRKKVLATPSRFWFES
jgi:hypothetical protein